jgi:hypothetical protein
MRLLVLVVKNTLNRMNHLKDIYLFAMIVCRSKMAHNGSRLGEVAEHKTSLELQILKII